MALGAPHDLGGGGPESRPDAPAGGDVPERGRAGARPRRGGIRAESELPGTDGERRLGRHAGPVARGRIVAGGFVRADHRPQRDQTGPERRAHRLARNAGGVAAHRRSAAGGHDLGHRRHRLQRPLPGGGGSHPRRVTGCRHRRPHGSTGDRQHPRKRREACHRQRGGVLLARFRRAGAGVGVHAPPSGAR